MSIEQLIADHTAALNENTAQLKVLNAGREQALEAINNAGGAAAPKPRASRKKADEPAGNDAAAVEPTTASTAAASPPAGEPAAAAATAGPSVESELRDATSKYIDAEGLTDDQKAARIGNIKAVMNHFGGMLCGPQSKLDDDQRAQALFYVRRYAAGCEVNFSQEYDFAGDPTQGGLEAAAVAEDEFNIG